MDFSTFGCNAYSVSWMVECWVFTTDAIQGHIILWGRGFHHRDISPGNMMYHYDGNSVVGVLNDWDLATAISSSGAPNTERTGTIPFMALQLVSSNTGVHMFRHDAESFIWLFLWVCGCSDGSKGEVLVAPYKVWRKLDMRACKTARGAFLSDADLEDINVSEHHGPNSLFCLFLAWLLRDLRMHIWKKFPTSADRNPQDQKDMALLKELLPKFREVRGELNKEFSPKDWFDDEPQRRICRYIRNTVGSIIDQISE